MNSPGAHHVYSTETSLILLRHDFNVATNYDGITQFGINKYYVPPPIYAKNVRQFNQDIKRQTESINPDAEVVVDDEEVALDFDHIDTHDHIVNGETSMDGIGWNEDTQSNLLEERTTPVKESGTSVSDVPNEAPQLILSEEKVVLTEEKVVPQPVSGKKKVVHQPVSTKEKVVKFDTTPMTPVLTKEKVVMVKEKVVPQPA